MVHRVIPLRGGLIPVLHLGLDSGWRKQRAARRSGEGCVTAITGASPDFVDLGLRSSVSRRARSRRERGSRGCSPGCRACRGMAGGGRTSVTRWRRGSVTAWWRSNGRLRVGSGPAGTVSSGKARTGVARRRRAVYGRSQRRWAGDDVR